MTYRIALIPGDGIGQELVPEGVRVLDALALRLQSGIHRVSLLVWILFGAWRARV
jgi:isocitrate/isopropylmalate dehydrogenase